MVNCTTAAIGHTKSGVQLHWQKQTFTVMQEQWQEHLLWFLQNNGESYSSVHNNSVQIANREKMNHACFWQGHKDSTPGSTPEKTVWQLSITLHSKWKNDQVESCALLHLHSTVIALITETITVLCIIIMCKYQLPGYTAESTVEIAVSDLPLVCNVT